MSSVDKQSAEMGGSAFASGPNPLDTPRMPPQVYYAVKEHLHGLLGQLFVCVASPIEGPAKPDYGDIDILVALEKGVVFPSEEEGRAIPTTAKHQHLELLEAVQSLLQSERAIVRNGQASANMAIPWPDRFLPISPGADDDDDDNDDNHLRHKCYIQVDVRICESVDQLQWMLFKHAHGDIWNLVGSMIRPFGLTVDEQALWIRIPDIEAFNRNRAKIFLSDDPADVLHFLGLPVDGFWDQPFPSVDALFEYVARSRFFWVVPGRSEDAAARRSAARGKLKSNDRRRMAGRPIFRRWVDDFIPQAQAAGRFPPPDPGRTPHERRDLVRRDAFERFPAAEAEYNRALDDWVRERQAEQVWKVAIKGTVPTTLAPQDRGAVCSALKKMILLDDESYGVVPPRPLRTPDGFWLVDEVAQFVCGHWPEVLAAAHSVNARRLREHRERKEAKRVAEALRVENDPGVCPPEGKTREERADERGGASTEDDALDYDDAAGDGLDTQELDRMARNDGDSA